MERAGRQGTPVFLIGGRQAVLDETCNKLRRQWNLNIVGAQNGYFAPADRDALLPASPPAARVSSPWRWDRRVRSC